MVAVDTKDIRRAAMDLLARREHGFFELERKLSVRFPREMVVAVLTRLQQERLQSDERFVESYVYSRRQRGFGPLRIRSELLQKGLESELITQHLQCYQDDWTALVRKIKEQKFGTGQPASARERARQIRFLTGRGFSLEQIYSLFSAPRE